MVEQQVECESIIEKVVATKSLGELVALYPTGNGLGGYVECCNLRYARTCAHDFSLNVSPKGVALPSSL